MSDREIYVAKMKLQLEELNVAMDELEIRTQHGAEDVRDRCRLAMIKLREQWELAVENFNELRTAEGDSWKNLIENTEKKRDAFIHAFHHFKSQL
jgi:hypothetical protein